MTANSPRSEVATERDPHLGRRWQWPAAADPAILYRLSWIENICLLLAASIAMLVLFIWLAPSMAPMMLRHWVLMKFNTAVLIVLASVSFALSQPRGRAAKPGVNWISKVLAALVLLTATAVLVEYLSGVRLGIDTLLVADNSLSNPGRMSPQTASAFFLIGLLLLFIHVTRRPAGLAVDVLVLGLIALVVFMAAGYAFGAMKFFGISLATQTSPRTLLALGLLCFVALCRRAETGFYSALAGAGIGSKLARLAVPIALVMPFLLEAGRIGFSRTGRLSPKSAVALITALAEIASFVVILLLAWHIDSQERKIRDLSLRDELTGLYNRRGFFLMAEGQLRLAQRTRIPFSVLFLDLDGLKRVNDTLGHSVGSDLIKEAAALIGKCFREADVVGRLGGDEFVVAAVANDPGIAQASARLHKAADDRNAEPGHLCGLHFSLGVATLEESRPEPLKTLVERADKAMYLVKRSKEQARL